MEGAHGELGARLADRLGGDHTDRLAEIDRRAAGEIAPVALGAYAVSGLAGESRADAHFLHARSLERLDLFLLDQLTALDDHFSGRRVLDVLSGGAAEHALTERHGHLASLEDGARGDARIGAAILLGDDAILRHVDETPREVAGVRRLQRGIARPLRAPWVELKYS